MSNDDGTVTKHVNYTITCDMGWIGTTVSPVTN